MSDPIEGFRQNLISVYNDNKNLSKKELTQKLVDVAVKNDIKDGNSPITAEEIKVLDEFIEKNIKGKFDIKAGAADAKWSLELEETLPNKVVNEVKGETDLFNRIDKTIEQMKKHGNLPKELEGKSSEEIRKILIENKDFSIRNKFMEKLEKTLKADGLSNEEAQKTSRLLVNNFKQTPKTNTKTNETTNTDNISNDYKIFETKNESNKNLNLQSKENVIKISDDRVYKDLEADRRKFDKNPTPDQIKNDFNFYQNKTDNGKSIPDYFKTPQELLEHMKKNTRDFDKFQNLSVEKQKEIAQRIFGYCKEGKFTKIEDIQKDLAAVSTKIANQLAENGANSGIDNKKGYATTLAMRYFSAAIHNTPKTEVKNYHVDGEVKVKTKQYEIEKEYVNPKIMLEVNKKRYEPKEPLSIDINLPVPGLREKQINCITHETIKVPTIKNKHIGQITLFEKAVEKANERRKEKVNEYNEKQGQKALEKEETLVNKYGFKEENVKIPGENKIKGKK